MNKILQYQSILEIARSILVQSLELFSARIWISGGQVIFQYKPGACYKLHVIVLFCCETLIVIALLGFICKNRMYRA